LACHFRTPKKDYIFISTFIEQTALLGRKSFSPLADTKVYQQWRLTKF
jgi:hypothetical protein